MSERQNAASYLKTSHLQADLGKRGARGAVVMMTSQVLKALLQIASTVALARLLTPDDFGVLAMAATVMNFVMIFNDLGLSQATIQREHLTGSQVTTLFWLNVLFSLGLMLIVIALAPPLALLYHEPRLTEVTMALSVGFLLTGLSVQSEALLKRQMRFIPIARGRGFLCNGHRLRSRYRFRPAWHRILGSCSDASRAAGRCTCRCRAGVRLAPWAPVLGSVGCEFGAVRWSYHGV